MKEYWYPWVPARYRADTLHLTPLEDGVYRRLIDHYMETKLPLPDSEVALSRIAGMPVAEFRQIAGTMLAFFKKQNGQLHSKRCDQVLLDQTERSDKHREKSAAGGKAKAEKYNNINANPATGKAQAMPNPATRQDKTDITDKKEKIVSIPPRKKFEQSDLSEMDKWFSENAPMVDRYHLRQKLLDWCDAKGKTYKDYFAALRNWATDEQGKKNVNSTTDLTKLTGHAALGEIHRRASDQIKQDRLQGKAARTALDDYDFGEILPEGTGTRNGS